ncbi:MAG: NAD-dependent epimerase/dehydratase family protein, partial [Pseudomonadota bacterium]
MNIFLTGAAGYIGSRLARRLLDRGHTVTGLVRRSGCAPEGVTEVVGDLADLEKVGDLARAANAVIHTAFGHEADFGAAVDIEIAAVDAMIAAASGGAAKPIVLTSAAGVLGDTGAEPAADNAPISTDFPARIRGFVEDRVRGGAPGARLMALRLPVLVHGDGGSQFAPLHLAAAERDGVSRYVGLGDNRLSSVHVDDAADAYLSVLERGEAGRVYNVASETVTGRSLAEAVAQDADVDRIESVDLQVMQDATHPFAALLTSMTFDLD